MFILETLTELCRLSDPDFEKALFWIRFFEEAGIRSWLFRKVRFGSTGSVPYILYVQEVVTPLDIVTYYIKWVTTSWTHSNNA